MLKFGFKKHSVGDISLVIEDYTRSDGDVILTQPFATTEEVHAEFAKLEKIIAQAKRKALEMVTPDEQGVTSAHRAFADVLKKADPES